MKENLIYFSAGLGGFLFEQDRQAYENGIGWPADALEISPNEYDQLLEGQTNGMTITANADGYPELVPTDANSVEALEAQKQGRLKEADSVTMVWRTELAMGSINDEDKEKLKNWIQYYKDVQAIDTTAPDVVFPAQPAK